MARKNRSSRNARGFDQPFLTPRPSSATGRTLWMLRFQIGVRSLTDLAPAVLLGKPKFPESVSFLIYFVHY